MGHQISLPLLWHQPPTLTLAYRPGGHQCVFKLRLCADESPSHITKYLDSGRIEFIAKSAKELEAWLRAQRTGRELIGLITSYLLARGGNTLNILILPTSPLTLLASFHDRLGWDNFLEGRISSLWVEMRHHKVELDNLQTTAEYWATGLI